MAFHVNCPLGRWFTLNVKPYFLWEIKIKQDKSKCLQLQLWLALIIVTLSSLQTNTGTSETVQIQMRQLVTCLIWIYTVCHSVVDCWLKPLFAKMNVSKFKAGRVLKWFLSQLIEWSLTVLLGKHTKAHSFTIRTKSLSI